MGQTYRGMRRYAGLSVEELAEKLGKSPQTIRRLEANNKKTAIKRDLEEKIVEITQVTKPVFAKILAETAGTFVGRRLAVLPPDALIPSVDLLAAYKLFSDHCYKLDPDERDRIEAMLDEARGLDASTERICRAVARDAIRRINEARLALGEDPAGDSED